MKQTQNLALGLDRSRCVRACDPGCGPFHHKDGLDWKLLLVIKKALSIVVSTLLIFWPPHFKKCGHEWKAYVSCKGPKLIRAIITWPALRAGRTWPRARQYQCSLTPSVPWVLWRLLTNVMKVSGLGWTVVRRHGWHVHGLFCLRVTTMILPQVHLRKPCYDFSFL